MVLPAAGAMGLDRLPRDLAEKALAVRVNGVVMDARTVVKEGDKVEAVVWDGSDDSKKVFWHSSAHLLGDAIEQYFEDNVLLCDGPPLLQQGGFFYEFQTTQTVSPADFQSVSERMQGMAARKRKFERMVLPMERAREMFAYNPFKLEVLDMIAARGDSEAVVYRSGDFVDLCRGPHVPNTGRIKWIKCLTASGSTGKLEGKDVPLQRIYGISFPTIDEGTQWEASRAELERRDHRLIGQKQNLLMFNDASPGSAFFLPDGAYIYNRLLEMLRKQYHMRGYQEVITPMLFQKKLWETSGHWDHYKNDMFFVEGEEQLGLKPMNCPSHCLIFGHTSRSHKELPLRFADFGVLHRNEQSGALTGLTRVRKFQQDDAHIFCREDQLRTELGACLDFLRAVYEKLGFGDDFSIRLATRPEKYVGALELWDLAEATLKSTLEAFKRPWTVEEGDGSFYGPKLDILVKDAMGRSHQCGTIQLDFQLPRRFNLTYVGEDGAEHVPVMIHRAILGSGERMFAVLTEQCEGKWPVWLNPRQVAILPVADSHREHAEKVRTQLFNAGVRVYVIDDGNTLQKRVRNAQLAHYNYVLVVGDDEMQSDIVSVRNRDHPKIVQMPFSQFQSMIVEEMKL